MTIYQWLCLFGIPTIILAIIGAFIAVFKSIFAQIKAMRFGVKALLRAEMIAAYNEHHEKLKYAPLYVKENFQNCWLQYHAIKGPNGVMDDIHDKFMRLPTEPPENNKEE